MKKEVLLFDADAWTLCIISATEASRPVTWKDTFKCVSIYLRKGKGSVMRRITSVLIRLSTCSLKPRQTSSSK